MNLIHTAVIPTEFDDEANLRELVKLMWTFKVMQNILYVLLLINL